MGHLVDGTAPLPARLKIDQLPGGVTMNETERLRDYIVAITSGRGVEARLFPVLVELLETPRARARYRNLSADEVRAVAREFVREERTPRSRRRPRRA